MDGKIDRSRPPRCKGEEISEEKGRIRTSSPAHSHPKTAVSLWLFCILLATTATSAFAQRPRRGPIPLTIEEVVPLGLITLQTGTTFMDTEVGGLSAISYDAGRDVYYVLSDDSGKRGPARYYTVTIDISEAGQLLDVTFLDVTFLRDKNGNLFNERSLDPEGMEWMRPGQLTIASEGDADDSPPIDPSVKRFNESGKEKPALPIPPKFLPDGEESYGVLFNRGFESLTTSPDRRFLYTATENALIQDGSWPTVDEGSPARLLQFSLGHGRGHIAEYVYPVSPISRAPFPHRKLASNGLVELQALDNAGTFLAMERSFALGVGSSVTLYETSIQGASDVAGHDPLPATYKAMTKRQVASIEALGYDPDNLEGMTFGPGILPGGYRPLILVSDNNFRSFQTTQFILLGVKLKPALAIP